LKKKNWFEKPAPRAYRKINRHDRPNHLALPQEKLGDGEIGMVYGASDPRLVKAPLSSKHVKVEI
jgi:hypothetical protein